MVSMPPTKPRPTSTMSTTATPGLMKSSTGKGISLNTARIEYVQVWKCEGGEGISAVKVESVLHSTSGLTYQLGPVIRKAKFGKVHRMYQLTSCMNEGSVCYVPVTGVELAVKVYSKREMISMRGSSEEDPVAEMTTLQKLSQEKHPNVLNCHECFHDSDSIYMVMPLYVGGDVLDVKDRREIVGKSRAFSHAESRHFFVQLVHGLNVLHSNGIAHRDLSIENILYDEVNDRYVIIDLGASITLPKDEETGELLRKVPKRRVFGKISYIAPELWRKEEFFDPMQCDIWAIGVILFMVMFDYAPMVKASVDDELFVAICNNELHEMVSPDERTPETMQAIDLMQKILRSNPDDRLTLKEIMAHPWMTTTCFK